MVKYLEQALELAQFRRGFCAPNPSVGAVVVKEGRILGSGYHHLAGTSHAEVLALAGLSPEDTRGATLYCTLEPCCHWGKTPPCTDLIIKHNLSQVVFGFLDPHPVVADKGMQKLLDAGIKCLHRPLPEINHFYASYAYWVKTGLPWITAKLALSFDGCIAGEDGQPIKLTGVAAQKFTHQQRQRADALLTTARTISCDDPLLNVRLQDTTIAKPVYILDSKLAFPLSSKLCSTGAALTAFYSEQRTTASQVETYQSAGIRCIPIPQQGEHLSLLDVLRCIGEDGRHDVWVEAGGQCFSALIEAELMQRAFIYVAPMSLGKGAQRAFSHENNLFAQANHVVWSALGADAVCEMTWPHNGA